MKSVLIFAALLLFAGLVNAQKKTAIRTSPDPAFIKPPLMARPKALWPWVNGNFSLSQISYELGEAKEKGMAGFDIWDCGAMVDPDKILPAGPAFLGDESLQAIAHTIREADRLGMEIGLISSSSWNAGGAWTKPENGAMGLFRSDTIIEGPLSFNELIPFPKLPEHSNSNNKAIRFTDSRTGLPVYYKEVGIIAHPYKTDSLIPSVSEIKNLAPYFSPGGQLRWEIPSGR